MQSCLTPEPRSWLGRAFVINYFYDITVLDEE